MNDDAIILLYDNELRGNKYEQRAHPTCTLFRFFFVNRDRNFYYTSSKILKNCLSYQKIYLSRKSRFLSKRFI